MKTTFTSAMIWFGTNSVILARMFTDSYKRKSKIIDKRNTQARITLHRIHYEPSEMCEELRDKSPIGNFWNKAAMVPLVSTFPLLLY